MKEYNVKINAAKIEQNYGLCIFIEVGPSGDFTGGEFGLFRRDISDPLLLLLVDGIMKICGVASWDKVPGRYVRIRLGSHFIEEVGHITDDRWIVRPKLLGNKLPETVGAPEEALAATS